jgi:hypothetical protein
MITEHLLWPCHGPAIARPWHGHCPAGPAMALPSPGHGPAMARPWPGYGPAMARPLPGHGPAMALPSPGHGPAMARPLPGHGPAMAQPCPGHCPAMARPWPGLPGRSKLLSFCRCRLLSVAVVRFPVGFRQFQGLCFCGPFLGEELKRGNRQFPPRT